MRPTASHASWLRWATLRVSRRFCSGPGSASTQGVSSSGLHIPGAASVPWARAAAEDGRFKARPDLEAIYLQEQGLKADDDIIAYCRIGERSSHTWFVLTHLLGFEKVRNYDGSWTEWGNSVRVPVVKGTERG